MARTKGAVTKPKTMVKSTNENSKSNDGEIVETKRRGRQPGQIIEREPAVIVELNKDYRIKMDKYNYTLQEKGKEKEKTEEVKDETEDKEDVGYKSIGYYPTNINGLISICNKMISVLTIKRAKKEQILSWERYTEIYNKTAEKVINLFPTFDEIIMKKKG